MYTLFRIVMIHYQKECDDICADRTSPDNLPDDGKLKSEVIVKDNVHYNLDLRGNKLGRSIKASSLSHHSCH